MGLKIGYLWLTNATFLKHVVGSINIISNNRFVTHLRLS